MHQQIHGRKVHSARNHCAGVKDFVVPKPPAPGDHPITCLLLVPQRTSTASTTCGFACRPDHIYMSAGLKQIKLGENLSQNSLLAEPAARRTADIVFSCRGRSRAPGVWIRPAHGIDDATDGVGEPAGHQERRTRRAQCSAHRARIRQHCPAEPYVDACLRRRTTSEAGTSLQHWLLGTDGSHKRLPYMWLVRWDAKACIGQACVH